MCLVHPVRPPSEIPRPPRGPAHGPAVGSAAPSIRHIFVGGNDTDVVGKHQSPSRRRTLGVARGRLRCLVAGSVGFNGGGGIVLVCVPPQIKAKRTGATQVYEWDTCSAGPRAQHLGGRLPPPPAPSLLAYGCGCPWGEPGGDSGGEFQGRATRAVGGWGGGRWTAYPTKHSFCEIQSGQHKNLENNAQLDVLVCTEYSNADAQSKSRMNRTKMRVAKYLEEIP